MPQAAPVLAKRFVIPTLSEADAQVAGMELEKIAQANSVNGIHHLDREVVFSLIESNPQHPMRKLFDWNDKSAARKQRVDYTGKLIATVQVCFVQPGAPQVFEPVYISAKAAVKQQGSDALRRTHVARPDMLTHDPAFVSVVNGTVSRMINELRKLEHTATARPLPVNVQQFIDAVRTAANNAGIG